jgi:F-type H+-transporting ATPase subunit c
MTVQTMSVIGAVLAVAVGSIAPALAEGAVLAAAMEGIARQPEAAGSSSRALFVGLAMIETMAIYCLVDLNGSSEEQSECESLPGSPCARLGARPLPRISLNKTVDGFATKAPDCAELESAGSALSKQTIDVGRMQLHGRVSPEEFS